MDTNPTPAPAGTSACSSAATGQHDGSYIHFLPASRTKLLLRVLNRPQRDSPSAAESSEEEPGSFKREDERQICG